MSYVQHAIEAMQRSDTLTYEQANTLLGSITHNYLLSMRGQPDHVQDEIEAAILAMADHLHNRWLTEQGAA